MGGAPREPTFTKVINRVVIFSPKVVFGGTKVVVLAYK